MGHFGSPNLSKYMPETAAQTKLCEAKSNRKSTSLLTLRAMQKPKDRVIMVNRKQIDELTVH